MMIDEIDDCMMLMALDVCILSILKQQKKKNLKILLLCLIVEIKCVRISIAVYVK